MPKVSIIVPCYNVSAYLERCLDSLTQQNLKDIEIICIDDKSTDNTLKILHKYAKIDSRIKLIELEKNTGVAIARNSGLGIAKGEYIGFVDPDDYVDLDFYEKLYNVAKFSKADFIKGNVISVNNNTKDISIDKKMENIEKHISNFSSAFWSAIYRKDFLEKNKILFPPYIITSQDAVFLAQVGLKAKKIKLVYDTYYHYFYQRPGSLDSQFLPHEKAESKYKAFCININLIENSKLSEDDMKLFIDTHVLSHVIYEIYKDFELDSDRKKFFDLLVNLNKKYNLKRFLTLRLGKRKFKNVLYNDYTNFSLAKKSRIYLFDFIPIILIKTIGYNKEIKLFDFLPILKISYNKVFLFNFILILKIR